MLGDVIHLVTAYRTNNCYLILGFNFVNCHNWRKMEEALSSTRLSFSCCPSTTTSRNCSSLESGESKKCCASVWSAKNVCYL